MAGLHARQPSATLAAMRVPIRTACRAGLLLLSAGFAASCDDGEQAAAEYGTLHQSVTLDEIARSRCDTPPELVDGLSRQLVDAINCLRPDTLAEIPLGGDIRMLREGRPNFIDARGLDALLNAAAEAGGGMVVRWAYRDVALQHLFWLQDVYQGCAVAAPAGLSNHQNGLAVDLNDYQEWEPVMRRWGWENNLPNDRVHFDYQLVGDIGLGSLSIYAFQALWNANFPNRALPLTGELDGATDAALADAPIEGFPTDLCADGVPPVGAGPLRGPTVAQQAWRGCDAPAELIEGLTWQIAQSMNCLQPDALAPLSLCPGAGCLAVDGPPKPEWLAPPAHDALLGISQSRGEPLAVRWAFRDVALQHLFVKQAENIACPGAAPSGSSDHNTGLAVNLSEWAALQGDLEAATFVQSDALDAIWLYDGPDAEDLTALNVLAFQELWNLNRPEEPIDADGLIGPQTRGAIERAPIAGFADSICGEPPEPTVRDAGVLPRPGIDAGPDGPAPPMRDATSGGGGEGGGPGEQPGRTPEPTDASGRDAATEPVVPDPPIPGWSAVGETGCDQGPGAPGGLLLALALPLVLLRRRRGH
jgi:hypothetical protein